MNVHNSPTHLFSSSSSSSVSPYAEFCDHSTWRRKNKSHRSVEGRSRFGVEARMNIKIRGRASILHGCTSNLQTSTRSLTCPGRKREENSGIRGAFSCKSGQRGPLFSDYARPTSRQIFRSVRNSYIHHVGDSPRFGPSLFIGRQWSRGRIEDADFVAKSLFTPCARRPSFSRRIHLGAAWTLRPGIRATSAGNT